MNADYFDWHGGEVVYWDLDRFNPDAPIQGQLDDLKEDLAQVRFGDDVLLDLGWYPEGDADGAFVVTVVRDEDWDEPIFRGEGASVAALRTTIEEAVRAASA